jgi:Uma2 family endonuclease
MISRSTGSSMIVDPDDKTVTVYRLHAQPRTLGIGDTVEGGDVLPGFSCEVAAIFEGLKSARAD